MILEKIMKERREIQDELEYVSDRIHTLRNRVAMYDILVDSLIREPDVDKHSDID